MFKNKKDALAAIAEHFPEKHLDVLSNALAPCIGFVPLSNADPALGQSRIGGTPDLPKDVDWPVRPSQVNKNEIAERGGSNHKDHILKHLSLDYPFEFFAQVDLAEATALGDVARELPNEGRLLFFYDSMSGPWNNGATVCKVIWDQNPKSSLVDQPIPDALQQLAAEYQKESSAEVAGLTADVEKQVRDLANDEGLAKEFQKLGMKLSDMIDDAFKQDKQPDAQDDGELVELKPPYWGPARAMQLVTNWGLPDRYSLEAQTNGALGKLFSEALDDDSKDEDFADAYVEFHEQYYEPREFGFRPHQLLGAPLCEQDEPRYEAVVSDLFGKPFLDPDEWQANKDRIMISANDWKLLLQIDLADYLQDELSEGTVYFLIKKEDLAAQTFSGVVAVYQQT